MTDTTEAAGRQADQPPTYTDPRQLAEWMMHGDLQAAGGAGMYARIIKHLGEDEGSRTWTAAQWIVEQHRAATRARSVLAEALGDADDAIRDAVENLRILRDADPAYGGQSGADMEALLDRASLGIRCAVAVDPGRSSDIEAAP